MLHGNGSYRGELFFLGGDAEDATITNDGGEVSFGSSDAGNSVITNDGGGAGAQGTSYVGIVEFLDGSTGNRATVTTNGGQFSGDTTYGLTLFEGSANAANATLISNGGNGSDTFGGMTEFLYGTATAGDATCIANGGVAGGSPGEVRFTSQYDSDLVTAGNATLIANNSSDSDGGIISFENGSDGGTARIEVFGNGNLNIGAHDAPGISTGSLEGDGSVFLGANNLTVGSNNLSTTFSGVIQDSGSFTKIGTGLLTLTGANTYTGGTTINAGTLKTGNTIGSATGTGPVSVNAGILGGQGVIAGPVTIGSGTGPGAILAPGAGSSGPRRLALQGSLTLKADGDYVCQVNTKRGRADGVVANGVVLENGTQFGFGLIGNKPLNVGKVFTIISNTSTNPINGTFSNLADGSILTDGKNHYQVSYEGGDGNDLTLTVVP